MNNSEIHEIIKGVQHTLIGSGLKISYLGFWEKIAVCESGKIKEEHLGRMIVDDEFLRHALFDFYFNPQSGLKNILKDILRAANDEKNYLLKYFIFPKYEDKKIVLEKLISILNEKIDKMS